MKVAIVSDWYLPRIGGLELHLRDLGRELSRHGHETHIICVTPAGAEAASESDLQGVRVHRLPIARTPRFDTIATPAGIATLDALLAELKPDVVHTHNAFSPLAHVGAFLAKRRGLPSLFTECSVLRGPVGRGLRLGHSLLGWGNWPTLLSGVSEFVAEDVRRATGRSEAFVLHNGIDASRWACSRREPDRPRVTTTMRFTKRKRPTDLVRMLPRVHAALPPDLRPVFTLIGDGPEMVNVRALAKKLDVEKWIELPGFQPREKVRDILAESSVFCLPTRKEAMSIASLEALAAGCPVVAMGLGGITDVVESGREGLLASNLDELCDHVVELISNHDRRRTMAAATRDRIGRFAWPAIIARHEELFRLAAERVGKNSQVADDP